MLAGCGSSSRSQTDNTESSSQNEASSSSASETADERRILKIQKQLKVRIHLKTQKHLHQQKPMIPLRQLLQMIRNLQEKLWLYIILQQELLKELHRQSQIQQAVIYLKSSRWNLIQMMIWTGQMMIVVYPENMMMKV